jgi:predicted dehydrogenase
VGWGSIGHRHIKNLLKYPDVEIIICTNKKSINTEIEKRCKIVKLLEDGIKETPDIAFITNVTSEHVSTAVKLAEHGINLFIEKPLSHSVDHIDELSEIIKRKKIKVMIGSNFRFHECIKKIKELLDENLIDEIISVRVECGSYLPDWHPNEDYRSSYAAQKELGGGVVLTCIHEIDYLHWFLGQVDEIVSFSGKYSDLELNVDDLSTALIKFKKNIIAEIHLDFFQRKEFRSCKIIGKKGTIYWDSDSNLVKLFDINENKWIEILKISNYDRNQMFMKELDYYLDCINHNKEPMNSVIESKEVLKIALGIIESSKTKQVVKI